MHKVKTQVIKKLRSGVGEPEILNSINELNNNISHLYTLINEQQQQIIELLKQTQENTIFSNEFLKATTDISKIPTAHGKTRLLQQGNLKLLQKIIKIFDKLKIEYYLDFGSLLGVVRHKDFIPWDDDIDISVSRHDYEKLLTSLDKELQNTKIWFTQGEIIRIFYDNTPLQIDIFPFDFCNKKLSADEKKQIGTQLFLLRESTITYDWSKLHTQENTIASPSYKQIQQNRKKYLECVDTKAEAAAQKSSICYGYESSFNQYLYTSHIHDFDWIFPLKKVNIQGFLFCVPNKPDYLLREYYGNYWEFPNSFTSIHDDIDARFSEDTIEKINHFISKD